MTTPNEWISHQEQLYSLLRIASCWKLQLDDVTSNHMADTDNNKGQCCVRRNVALDFRIRQTNFFYFTTNGITGPKRI